MAAALLTLRGYRLQAVPSKTVGETLEVCIFMTNIQRDLISYADGETRSGLEVPDSYHRLDRAYSLVDAPLL